MSRPIRTYDRYEIVKVPFPFTDSATKKVRPALILSSATDFNGKIGFSIMAMITSLKPDQDLWPADVVIKNLSSAGLPVASIIRFKIFTLEHKLILDRIGNLAEIDRQHVQKKIKEVFIV